MFTIKMFSIDILLYKQAYSAFFLDIFIIIIT